MPVITAKLSKHQIDKDKFKDGIVRIGWFNGVRYEDGVPVAMVARVNEFGVPGRIPARPFMRPVVHGKGPQLVEKLRNEYKQAIKDNRNTAKVLERFGIYVETLVRGQIMATVTPPNSPYTLRHKRGTHPLIDTGFMVETLTHQTEEIKR